MAAKSAQPAQKQDRPSSTKTLLISVFIIASYAIVEAIGGWKANSLTLLSDAGQMGVDAFGLSVAAFAAWMSNKPPTKKITYGFGRVEVITALLSSLFLILIVIGVGLEALRHLRTPEEVGDRLLITIAFLGLLVNICTAWVLNRGEQNLNTQAAFLHVLTDLFGSVAALSAGIIIFFTHWTRIDPILSLVMCLFIIIITLRLLKKTIHVLMEGTPEHIDMNELINTIVTQPHIRRVHDLHVWTVSAKKLLLSAHIQIDVISLHDWQKLLDELRAKLRHKYHINHITIQPEINEYPIHFRKK
ncbi:MAG: hypothetical protein A2X77_06255 [Gammaproteobacteria bacterium GWE2_42_36]|nr:MAG: hypothetical protein A2X77_06255 [Gammaproteobacteria bacterium GWE2_42_36]HCU05555.1 cation transporter [Coxiellaceae bacterium]